VTGLRYCDARALTWANIDTNNTLTVIQSKTRLELVLPLSPEALYFAGPRSKDSDLIFPLPSNNGCNKSLRAWAKEAQIGKDITYHCARHSLGTNLHLAGLDAFGIAAVLGHTTIKHTQRYVRRNQNTIALAASRIPTIGAGLAI
jgi:integrase